VPDEKFRQMMSCADSPDTARDAMADGAFRAAFVEGDKVLGLNPVKLEKTGGPESEPVAEAEDVLPDEGDG
jgi:hypothetical protein